MKNTVLFFNQKQLKKLVTKLTKKNFVRLSVCAWSEIWKNTETEEVVTLVRG